MNIFRWLKSMDFAWAQSRCVHDQHSGGWHNMQLYSHNSNHLLLEFKASISRMKHSKQINFSVNKYMIYLILVLVIFEGTPAGAIWRPICRAHRPLYGVQQIFIPQLLSKNQITVPAIDICASVLHRCNFCDDIFRVHPRVNGWLRSLAVSTPFIKNLGRVPEHPHRSAE